MQLHNRVLIIKPLQCVDMRLKEASIFKFQWFIYPIGTGSGGLHMNISMVNTSF